MTRVRPQRRCAQDNSTRCSCTLRFKIRLIAEMAGASSARLIPIDRSKVAAIQEQHHFLKAITIPGGTYKNQDDDLLTVGMDVLLVCREDLPEPLVYDLARTLFDVVPQLAQAHASAARHRPRARTDRRHSASSREPRATIASARFSNRLRGICGSIPEQQRRAAHCCLRPALPS